MAGAVVLVAMVRARDGTVAALRGGGAIGPCTLFVYAVPFSFAYVRIGAAVGALVLFGAVQIDDDRLRGVVRGERPSVAHLDRARAGDGRPGAVDGAGGEPA